MCIRDRGCVIELEGRLRGDSQDGKTSNGALNPEGFAAHPGSDVFAHVLEQVADAIMVMDAQARIIYVNPAYERLIGAQAKTILGRKPAAFDDESLGTAYYHDMWVAIQRKDIWRGNLRIRRSDDAWRDTDVTISPMGDTTGAFTGHLVVLRDITGIRLLERQFIGAQKMEAVGRLAGGIAHDFNNLLTAIIGYTELGQGQSADRAATLCRQLLAFSRRQFIQPRVVDLSSIMESTSELLRQLTSEDVQLTLRCKEGLWPVEVDPGQIEQIATNLAINASDAMPGGGKLTIETADVELGEEHVSTHLGSRPGPHVMLAVSDTGTGIDSEILPHVFEPFFTTKERGKGTGLGLATVYGIVKQNGGNIWVYSEVGRGTTFKIYLPRADKPVDWTPESKPAQRQRVEGGHETILVVEDEPAVRVLTGRILKAAGYTILAEGDPAEALKLYDEYGGVVHLLLTDVALPGMSGKALAESLAVKQGVQPRVLFMSGYIQDDIVREGRLAASVDFLEKPFTSEGLLGKVREVLDRPAEG